MLQRIENLCQFVSQQGDEVYYDLTFSHTPSRYIHWCPYLGEQGGWKERREEEITDLELLLYVKQSTAFQFLHDPAEDTYDLADGKVI
jgi:hypothetical protein